MLPIAKILKSYGTDGAVLVGLRGTVLEEINFKEPVYIEFDGLPVPFFILDAEPKGGKVILHLNDVTSEKDAEEIVGRDICLDADAQADDVEDFIGWTVYDRNRKLGQVDGIEPIPGNLCLYIGELMIPLHEDFILDADPKSRVLRLSLPEGLC